MLEDKQRRQFLDAIPGAKLTADGIMISTEDKQLFLNNYHPPDPDLTEGEAFFRSFCSKSEIFRLREIRDANDYLLKMRAEAIVDSPRQVRVFDKRKRDFITSKRSWSLTGYYNSLNKVPNRYLDRLPIKLRKQAKSVPFGFVQQNEPNAMCYKTIVGEIIIVSEALRHFFYFISIYFFGYNFGIAIQDTVAAGRIAVRIMVGSETLDFDIDSRGELPTKANAMIRQHVDLMIEFTFAHEYGHLLMGHLSDPTDYASPMSDLELKTYAHTMEFEADTFAATSAVGKKARAKLQTAGLHVFTCFHFLEEFAKRQTGFPDFSVSRTHPTPFERMQNLSNGTITADDKSHLFEVPDPSQIVDFADFLSETITTSGRPDLLSFPGSIYIAGLGGKTRKDRFDF